MPNILKRPMFRRGGPASYGVGITSGLERKKYQEGTDPYENTSLDMNIEGYPYDQEVSGNMEENVSFNIPSGRSQTGADTESVMKSQIPTMEAYADVVEKRLRPTDKESVFDFLTSIGAAGAGSPTSLRTFGSVFGEAAKNYQNINAPKVQAAKKAGADVFSSLLKGSLTKEKLYLYQQQAQDLAKVRNIPYNEALKIVLANELGGKDKTKEIIESAAQKKPTFGTDPIAARAEAEIEYKISTDPEYAKRFGDGRFKGSIKNSLFQKDRTTGNYVLKNPQQKGTTEVNDVFVEPISKTLYYFDGKKLVPTK
jgi:hypothetical protein